MSETFAVLLDRVRETMADCSGRGAAKVDLIALAKIANDRLQAVAEVIGLGETVDASFITLVTADFDYVVPATSIEYLRVLSLAYVPTGRPLTPVPPEEILESRGSNAQKGPPERWSIQPQASDGKWLVQLDPEPSSAESGKTLRAELRLVPEFLDLETVTTDTVPFDSPLLRAFEQDVAAHALMSMPQSKRDEHGVTQDMIQRLLDGCGWNPKAPDRISGPYLAAWRRHTAGRRSRHVKCYGITRPRS